MHHDLHLISALTLLVAGACSARSTPAPEHAHGHPGAHEHGHGEHGHDAPTAPHAHAGAAAHHHDFRDAERFAKMFDDPARDAWQRPAEVTQLLELAPGMSVADIGAGTGYFLPHLGRAVAPSGQVLALDVEPAMVRHMEQRITREQLRGVTPRVVSPSDPQLGTASVDRVLIVDTWHHIESRVEYATKLHAALRPGGRIVVVDFTKDSPHGPPAAMRLSEDAVKRELEAAGLRAEIVHESLPYQYVVVAHLP